MLDLVGKHTVGFSHEAAHLLRMCESRSTYMYHVFLHRTRFLFFSYSYTTLFFRFVIILVMFGLLLIGLISGILFFINPSMKALS